MCRLTAVSDIGREGMLVVCVLCRLLIEKDSTLEVMHDGQQRRLTTVTQIFGKAHSPNLIGRPKIFLFLDKTDVPIADHAYKVSTINSIENK
jgi:hypothetical protein